MLSMAAATKLLVIRNFIGISLITRRVCLLLIWVSSVMFFQEIIEFKHVCKTETIRSALNKRKEM